jgi:hypothetical protein
MKTTTILLALLCSACGPDWQAQTVERYDLKVAEFSVWSQETDDLFPQLAPYLDKLLPEVEGALLLDLGHDDLLGIVDLVSINVWPEEQLPWAAGVWIKPYTIAIRHAPADTMLRVFGHELMRIFEANDGHYELAFQSSNDWSGEMGALWSIAEKVASE